MKVLSLFDGISCGMVALQRVGIPIERYVAYEIDKYAIAISRKHFPQIEHCGDVTKADFTQYEGFDLIIGGSPCQGFSVAGKQLNFNDPRSKLYFEFERAVQEVKPKYFMLENVTMKREYADLISERLGVAPIEINSNLCSAQNRRRLYWTNIPGVEPPIDKGIKLADIVHENTTDNADLDSYKIPNAKALVLLEKEAQKGKIGRVQQEGRSVPIYTVHGKTVTMLSEASGDTEKKDKYLFGCLTPDRENKRQNGQRFNTGEKAYTLTAIDKHGILIDGYIRKLTEIECERLQTLSDNYTKGIPSTQRYKCLGNGWTVDVIAHILQSLPHL